MKGGMNSHDVDEKRPKLIVYLAYKITAHTTNCMDIYDLQHIVLHAACLLAVLHILTYNSKISHV